MCGSGCPTCRDCADSRASLCRHGPNPSEWALRTIMIIADAMPAAAIDPIMLEIIRNRWQGVADEMCAALVRASYSTNIKDRRDCSAAIALPNGEVLAQAEVGTPLHLGIMPAVIRSVLAEFSLDQFQPGDMIITNLPYPEGPGHLPDLSMVSVIFDASEEPIAIAATTAHHVDMGGYAPGSMPLVGRTVASTRNRARGLAAPAMARHSAMSTTMSARTVSETTVTVLPPRRQQRPGGRRP